MVVDDGDREVSFNAEKDDWTNNGGDGVIKYICVDSVESCYVKDLFKTNQTIVDKLIQYF